jgi:isohexenylglutaconyl-CoA hydratase
MTTLPDCRNFLLRAEGAVLHATINRPEARNALSREVIEDFHAIAACLEAGLEFRALVLRGAGGVFCAGGDVKGFMESLAADAPENPREDPAAKHNRLFGDFLLRLNALPQVVIAVVEGAAFGGGLGLTCISDVAIGFESAKFALSETGLGIPPAQIAPFVVQRIGITNARHIALTGTRFTGAFAREIGLLHYVVKDEEECAATLARVLGEVARCAPGANAATKKILMDTLRRPVGEVLDDAAVAFAAQLRSEGREGILAFMEKRPAAWVENFQ